MNSLSSRYKSFVESISDQPYYRICAAPCEVDPCVISTEDKRIREVLRKPPNKRWAGFGVTGLWEQEVFQSENGINGRNITGGQITLLMDGYFEVICPIDVQFHRGWGSPQFAIPKSVKWLYPYVVIEFPVSFMRLVKVIYDESGIESEVIIQQSYHNINGYALPEGPPTYPTFGAFLDERGIYEKVEPITSVQQIPEKEWVCDNFIADHVAYALVADVYAKFGLDSNAIPAFDENRRFILE